MMEQTTTMEHSKECFFKKISYQAVIIGALVGLGISFLLSIFSLAIGLTAFSTTDSGVTAFAVGGFLALLISLIVAMFVAGWVSGFLAKWHNNSNWGVLYGFVTWTIALLLLIGFSAPFASFLSSYSGYITNQKVVILKNSNAPTQVQTIQTNQGETQPTTNAQQTAADIAKVTFAIFVLFFISALAACFGGYAGMSCKRCYKEQNSIH